MAKPEITRELLETFLNGSRDLLKQNPEMHGIYVVINLVENPDKGKFGRFVMNVVTKDI